MGGHPVLGVSEKVPIRLSHPGEELVKDVVAVHQHDLSRETLDSGLFNLKQVPEVDSHGKERSEGGNYAFPVMTSKDIGEGGGGVGK